VCSFIFVKLVLGCAIWLGFRAFIAAAGT